jgi:hypothetical protein
MNPFPIRRLFCSALVAVALGGCVGIPVVDNVYYDVAYQPLEYSGDLPLMVRGEPYALPSAEIDRAVVSALQGLTYGVGTHFVDAPDGDAPVHRMVLMFNPPPGLGPYRLCSRPQPPAAGSAPPAPRVGVIAALCLGDRAINYAEGSIATGAGPSSPEFRDGIVRFGLTLLPSRNPGDNPGTQFPT